jgi:site-specific DNA-methyltransferase (adenine-specific)
MNTDLMFSSKTDQWATPQDFFDALNKEFNFTLDVCATPENAKCQNYYTPEVDGLSQPWNGNVWCNPPYGREIGSWVKRAFISAATGYANVVVMLLPARTDTQWFHKYIYGKAEIRFVQGRLKFGGHKNAAPFPSMVVVFGGAKNERP